MISLSAGQSLFASSSASNVTFTLVGNIGNTQSVLAQGFFLANRAIFTATANTTISKIYLHNYTGIDTIMTLRAVENAAIGTIYTAELFVGYSATLTDVGWTIYDANGAPVVNSGCTNITVSSVAPVNPSLGDLWVQI